MSELVWNLLALPVPLLLLTALALGLSRIPDSSLAEASNWGAVAVIAGAVGLGSWVMVVWVLEGETVRPPAAPPVVLELKFPLGGELAACAASGGVQMVYADGAWMCVPAEQAG